MRIRQQVERVDPNALVWDERKAGWASWLHLLCAGPGALPFHADLSAIASATAEASRKGPVPNAPGLVPHWAADWLKSKRQRSLG